MKSTKTRFLTVTSFIFCWRIISSLFLITSLFSGCNMGRNKGEGITIIDIANDFSNEREFRLSEIAYDIEYIKLVSCQL